MLKVWNKQIARAKKKLSPRSLLQMYPPLDPSMAKFKDTMNEKNRQINWTIIVRELKKFGIDVNAKMKELLIKGNCQLISILVSMIVDFD